MRSVATTYRPSRSPHLYIRYRLAGKWLSRATEFVPGQEAEALAYAATLETPAEAGRLTVQGYGERWLSDRSERIRDWTNDRQRLRDHVYPVIGRLALDDVRPRHLVEVVDRLRDADAAPRTIRNVYSVAKALFRDARIADLCTSDPCILTARQLGPVQDKDLGWRGGAVLSREELSVLVGAEPLPLLHRVLWGLLGVAGLRDGEAVALRWGRVLEARPLARLVVVASNDRDSTKTGAERWVPVHPTLHGLLLEWKREWPSEYGRAYGPDDLVLPAPVAKNRGPRKAAGSMLDRHWTWKRLQSDLDSLGLRRRRVHDLRRTFISLAVEDGADENILRRATHQPPRHVMGLYTSVAWATLCREVAKLRLAANPGNMADDGSEWAWIHFRDEDGSRPF